MRRWTFRLLAFIPLLGLNPRFADAQSATVWSPKYGRPDQPINIFAEWRSEARFDALQIELPDDWRLLRAEQVDDARMMRLPLNVEHDKGAWTASAQQPMASPLRIVLTVLPKTGETTETVEVRSGNRVPTKSGTRWESVGTTVRVEIPIESARVATGNALNLEAASRRWAESDEMPPVLPGTASFSIEFWLQTVDLDAVVASTWNGDEARDYPFEFVIDAGGNLRCYSGLNGMHYSVISERPIADGTWHHVAYVRDAEADVATLFVDGKADDSVYLPSQAETDSYPIAIGGRVETGGTIEGLFDELRIWTGSRDAEKIAIESHLPSRSLPDRPAVFEDFESPLPPSLEGDESLYVASDLALHQPVHSARASVRSGAVEIEWRLTGGEAQTVTLERSENGSLFVPVYLVNAAARRQPASSVDRTYSFIDADVGGSSVFFYRFTQDFRDGSQLVSNTLKVGLGETETPVSFNLIGNSPNPFVNSTHVFFETAEAMHVRISVWDLSGHLVEWLVNQTVEPGSHQVQFSADNLPSGTYFVRMESSNGVMTKKMILRK